MQGAVSSAKASSPGGVEAPAGDMAIVKLCKNVQGSTAQHDIKFERSKPPIQAPQAVRQRLDAPPLQADGGLPENSRCVASVKDRK